MKKQTQRTFTRRNAILGGLCLLAAGATLYFAIPKNQKKDNETRTSNLEQITFQNAKQNPSLRQDYIDQIITQHPPPIENVDVIYDGSRDFYPISQLASPEDIPLSRMMMKTIFDVPAKSEGVIENVKIFIYRKPFKLTSEEEFLNVLLDHEYYHIKLFTGDISITLPVELVEEFNVRAFGINGDLFEISPELYTYKSQISTFSERKNLSDPYKRMMIATYNYYRDLLNKKEKTPLTNWLLNEFPKIE